MIPPDLLTALYAEAKEDCCPAEDVLRHAVAQYIRERRWQQTLAKGAASAKSLGLTEEDVPRLIAEFRQEQREVP